MITDPLVCDCGARYFPRRDNVRKCRQCAAIFAPWYTCERCDRDTQIPLMEVNGEMVCLHCQRREPDPTPAEIAAACAEIRAGWTAEETELARQGIRAESE